MKRYLSIDSSSITDLLGTVGSPLIVISELIKNAIDASADNISITYDRNTNSITVSDDGKGFSLDDILRLSTPGISIKKRNGNLKNEKGIFYTGSKGLGLLSAFSLCNHVKIQTINELCGEYIINWSKIDGSYSYEKIEPSQLKKGTIITLNNVYPQVMTHLTTESEIRKLRQISTYLYKHEFIKIPNITLTIDNGEANSLLLKTDFKSMLYDVNFRFDSNSRLLTFQCISNNKNINNEPVVISSFDTISIEKILEQHYRIKDFKFIKTRTNESIDFTLLGGVSGVPSFEGRILVYEKKTAGDTLKNYGAGVKFYVNDFALYNYLSDGFDWLELADFSQRRKVTRLKPHNVFGYVNLPNFDETKEQLKISNERADFIQDIVFVKLMYLIKGVIMFIILNIDLAEKNSRLQNYDTDTNNNDINYDQLDDIHSDIVNKLQLETYPQDNNLKNGIQMISYNNKEIEVNEPSDGSVDPEDQYEPQSLYKPQFSKKKTLYFTKSEGEAISRLKNVNELCNKIYQIVYELSNLNIHYYPYSTVCLYRSLIESATEYACKNLSVNYNDLPQSIINVLNKWSNKPNITKEFQSQIRVWRDWVKNRELMRQLNLYVHHGCPVDIDLIYESWKAMKGYIYQCIKTGVET